MAINIISLSAFTFGNLYNLTDISKRISCFPHPSSSGARKCNYIHSLPHSHKLSLSPGNQTFSWGGPGSPMAINTLRSFNALGRKYSLLANWWKFHVGQFLEPFPNSHGIQKPIFTIATHFSIVCLTSQSKL